jgi:hypothetical protein
MNQFFSKISVFVVIILVTLVGVIFLSQKSYSTTPMMWLESSLIRIDQEQPPAQINDQITLSLAKGEVESLQVGIRATKGKLTNVNVTISDLINTKGQLIDHSNFTLYREHYIEVKQSSYYPKDSQNQPLKKGWYADGLIPFRDPQTKKDLVNFELDAVPFNLESDVNQPIWIDLSIPRQAEAGTYQGMITVSSDQGTITGNITVNVWNFALPLKPSLHSAFDVRENEDLEARIELLKHKVIPPDIDPEDQRELIDQWGLTSRRLPLWSGASGRNCQIKPAPSVEFIQEIVSQYQSDLLLYARFADEIDDCPDLIEPVKEWADHIHQAGVKTAIAMTPTPDLEDDGTERSVVDIWIVLPKMYNDAKEQIAKVLAKGDQVWFYNALVQDAYSPKWEIDFEPINFRIPHGFINQSLGLTGVLYWRVDLWTEDPWHDVDTYPQNNKHYPGEGMLVYPGSQVGVKGVIPSMRLKWIRDGVEDYEYVDILKQLGQEEWAINLIKSIAQDWENWTKNPQELELIRQQLGSKINSLVS